MRRAYLEWFFAVFVASSSALPALAQNAKLGFYPPTSPRIPKSVTRASHSVFSLSTPLLRYIPKNENLESIFEKLIPDYQNIKDQLDPETISTIRQQINECDKNPDQLCVLYSKGSAFLAEDQTSLWTALHNLHNYIGQLAKDHNLDLTDRVSEEELTTIKKFEIPLRLYDSSGALIFGQTGDYATVEFIDPLFKKGMRFGVDIKFMDYIRLRLSRAIDREPLKFNKNKSLKNAGEAAYLVGFPKETKDRIRFGKPDSDGKSIRVSLGPILNFETAAKRYGHTPDKALRFLDQETAIYTASDCVAGHSGSPLLDRRGEVIGLFNSTTADNIGVAGLNSICYSIRARYLLEFTKIDLE